MGFEERMKARQQREQLELVKSRMQETGSRETTATSALDAIGRPLAEADGIFRIDLNGPPLFRVAGIQPVVDPNLPPGLVDVHVICFHTLRAKAGVPIPSVVRIGGAGELPPMPVAVMGTQAMPEETTEPVVES
jgi:hypothetical protein